MIMTADITGYGGSSLAMNVGNTSNLSTHNQKLTSIKRWYNISNGCSTAAKWLIFSGGLCLMFGLVASSICDTKRNNYENERFNNLKTNYNR